MREPGRHRVTRWPGAAALALALLATGCLSLTNHSQSCTSSGGLLGPSEFSCSGTAQTVKGEGPLSFNGEDDSDPNYRMDLTASVESGRMDVFADDVDGDREGGEVSPGNPIQVQAIVPSSDEDVSVTLSVKGGEEAEVGGLAYEATFTEAE
ncbi:MAG TPA: hypothetical protein VKA73_02945 [Rubrobacter sp.]|nr:hypothetical protein [Rubrobacter sp.]